MLGSIGVELTPIKHIVPRFENQSSGFNLHQRERSYGGGWVLQWLPFGSGSEVRFGLGASCVAILPASGNCTFRVREPAGFFLHYQATVSNDPVGLKNGFLSIVFDWLQDSPAVGRILQWNPLSFHPASLRQRHKRQSESWEKRHTNDGRQRYHE